MRRNLIDLFFLELDRELGRRGKVILTGAAAGSLLGNVRGSLDIDFEIRLKRRDSRMDDLVRRVGRKVGVGVNFSEDITHWSMIDYLEYRRRARPYKKFGRLDVRVMAPEYWTIGKMTRYLAIDIDDMVRVIRARRLGWRVLARLWARAVVASPLSLASGQFRGHVKHFFSRHGRRVWGKTFDPVEAVALFERLARIKR